jgi:hypothetical protein
MDTGDNQQQHAKGLLRCGRLIANAARISRAVAAGGRGGRGRGRGGAGEGWGGGGCGREEGEGMEGEVVRWKDSRRGGGPREGILRRSMARARAAAFGAPLESQITGYTARSSRTIIA